MLAHGEVVRVDCFLHGAGAVALNEPRHGGQVEHVRPVEQLLRPVDLEADGRHCARTQVPNLRESAVQTFAFVQQRVSNPCDPRGKMTQTFESTQLLNGQLTCSEMSVWIQKISHAGKQRRKNPSRHERLPHLVEMDHFGSNVSLVLNVGDETRGVEKNLLWFGYSADE